MAITPCPVSFTLLFERIYKGSLSVLRYILNGNTLRNLTQVELEALPARYGVLRPFTRGARAPGPAASRETRPTVPCPPPRPPPGLGHTHSNQYNGKICSLVNPLGNEAAHTRHTRSILQCATHVGARSRLPTKVRARSERSSLHARRDPRFPARARTAQAPSRPVARSVHQPTRSW